MKCQTTLSLLIFKVFISISFSATVIKEKCVSLEELSKHSCAVVDPSTTSDQSSERAPCFCSSEICGNYSLTVVKSNCPSGQIHTNKCGACVRCAKDVGEPCGGPADYLGICSRGLTCDVSSKSQGEGKCVSSKSSDGDGPSSAIGKPTIKLSAIKNVCGSGESKSKTVESKETSFRTIGDAGGAADERKDLSHAWRQVLMDEPLPDSNPNQATAESVQGSSNDDELQLGKMIEEFDNIDDAKDFLKKKGFTFEEVSGSIKEEINHLQRGDAIQNPLEVMAQQGLSPGMVEGDVAAGNVNKFPTFLEFQKSPRNRLSIRPPKTGFSEAVGNVSPKNSLILGKVIETFKTEEEAQRSIKEKQLNDVEMVSGDAISTDIQRGEIVEQPFQTLSQLKQQPQIVDGAIIAGPKSKFTLLYKP